MASIIPLNSGQRCRQFSRGDNVPGSAAGPTPIPLRFADYAICGLLVVVNVYVAPTDRGNVRVGESFCANCGHFEL